MHDFGGVGWKTLTLLAVLRRDHFEHGSHFREDDFVIVQRRCPSILAFSSSPYLVACGWQNMNTASFGRGSVKPAG